MPHRFVWLERIAFSVLTLSAVLDAGYISYEKSPNLRENLHQIAVATRDMSLVYPTPVTDQWMPIASN